MQFIPLYDIIIGDGYGYLINSRFVGSKGVCPWGKHLGYALCLPLGQTLGLRTFAGAKVRARARSNRGGVVNIVAVLHHKVVASLRYDLTI